MKYQVFNDEILRIVDTNGSLAYSTIAKMIIKDNPDEKISEGSLRKYISIFLNSKMQITKQIFDKNGELIKEIKSLRVAEIQEIPKGFEAKKIVSLGHGTQNITYEKEKTNQFNLIEDSISKLINEIKTIEPIKINKTNKTNNLTLCIYTSDKHIGSSQDDNDLYKELHSHQDKMYNIFCEVLKLKNRFGTFEKVLYFDLGDSLDGFNKQTTRGGHELQQNLNNRQQFDKLVASEIKFIKSLIKYEVGNDYKFIATTNDNHSGDFAYFAWRLIFDYVKHVYDFPTLLSVDFLNYIKVGIHDIIFTHGKDMKYKKHGLPLNLDHKTEIFIKEFILENGLKNARLIKGDLHQSGFNRGKWFDYVNVASVIGNTTYTTTNYGQNLSGCYFEVFEENNKNYLGTHFKL